MPEITTTLSIPEFKNLIKETLIEVNKESTSGEPEKTYSINQAAKIIKCSHNRVKTLISKGKLSVNKNNRITQSELNNFLS